MGLPTKARWTLIELLIVVAVIGILVAILLPSLGRAKNMAARMQCSNNMKTAYSAFSLYAQDYNNYIVPYSAYYPCCSWTIFWMQYMAYLGIVYTSPDYTSPSKTMPRYMCPAVSGEKYNNTDKGWNCWGLNYYTVFSYPVAGSTWNDLKNFRNVKKPSETLFIADVADTEDSSTTKYSSMLYSDPDAGTVRGRITPRHGGKKAPVIFFDGHSDTTFNPLDAPKSNTSTFWNGR